MLIPSQGFRHAATLLLTNSVRAIPPGASSEAIGDAFARVARELTALADDMRAPGIATEWLISEFNAAVERLPQECDRDRIKSTAGAILARVALRTPDIEPRDLFLMYAPEDRLPIAGPLAIELTKRRVSVAFAGYEVATVQQFADMLVHGLDRHRGGVVLWTKAFERMHGQPHLPQNDRLRIVSHAVTTSIVTDLADWVRELHRTQNR